MAGGTDPHAGLTAEQLAAAGAAMTQSQQFTDSPPAHWKKLPPSAMLLGKYQIEGPDGTTVDVTFSTLRSAPGGLLANINRWRDQLGKDPFAEDAALKENTRMVPSGFGEAVFIEIEGILENSDTKKDGRLIGAIAESGASAWFFKLRGNEALAAAERVVGTSVPSVELPVGADGCVTRINAPIAITTTAAAAHCGNGRVTGREPGRDSGRMSASARSISNSDAGSIACTSRSRLSSPTRTRQ